MLALFTSDEIAKNNLLANYRGNSYASTTYKVPKISLR
jgi:hypothetical protein